ncbi:MAG: hypothetical protein K2H30_00945 [Clostridia bacterium]|nr:hypothetical protein [Clostridia bacterium]MDE7265184.1 hypothetical protein [Clostridia bacterium]
MSVSEAEKALGYTFKDKELLLLALTLPSASGENNQQLEFFGDAILEFIVSELIFAEGGSEGEMTDRRKILVSDAALDKVSRKLGLDGFLIRSKSDMANKKAIPSVYEAVVAAIYLDGGLEAAKKFTLETLDFNESKPELENFKGKLQEALQSRGHPCPVYIHTDVGTPQKHKFKVILKLFGERFTAEADCIKAAEQLAARAALEHLNNNKNGKL